MIKKTLIAGGISALALVAGHAFAGECSDDQQSAAGMLAAGIGKDAVSKVIAVTGKQLVNVENC